MRKLSCALGKALRLRAVQGTEPLLQKKVVRPAQNPGNKRWRSSVTPRRSIKTKSAHASATPIKFAAKVPVRSSGIAIPSAYRTSVPAIPPIETRTSDFREVELSW